MSTENTVTYPDELIIAAKNNDTLALQTVLDRMKGIIYKHALASFHKYQSMSLLDLNDYISVASIGVITAVQKFDISKGVKFSTFADHVIRHELRRNILTRNCGVSKMTFARHLELYGSLMRNDSMEALQSQYKYSAETCEYLLNLPSSTYFEDLTANTDEPSDSVDEALYAATGASEAMTDYHNPADVAVSRVICRDIQNKVTGYCSRQHGSIDPEQIVKAILHGASYSDIARQYNCSRQYVNKIAHTLLDKIKNDETLRQYAEECNIAL